jgi:hypothetical protein
VSTKITHTGYIKKGCLFLNSKGRFKGELKDFPDCDVDVIVKRKGKASSQSRRYYFGVVVREITLELKRHGNQVDEQLVHELLKLECNKQPVCKDGGEVIGYVGGTTTDHNLEERGEYIEACIQYAAERLGIAISPPNTQTEFLFEDNKAA